MFLFNLIATSQYSFLLLFVSKIRTYFGNVQIIYRKSNNLQTKIAILLTNHKKSMKKGVDFSSPALSPYLLHRLQAAHLAHTLHHLSDVKHAIGEALAGELHRQEVVVLVEHGSLLGI